MEIAMKAVVSGTSILNHTVKNEMMKISMSAEMCKDIGLDEQQETYIDHNVASSEHLLGMTRRLQRLTYPPICDHMKTFFRGFPPTWTEAVEE